MLGLAVGLLCGAVELLMLTRLVAGLRSRGGAYTAALFFVKLGVMAAGIVFCVLVCRDDLLWFACGATGVLIIGSIVTFCKNAFSDAGEKEDAS